MSIKDRAEILDRIIHEVIPKDKSQPIKHEYMKDALKAIQELNKMSGAYMPDRKININIDDTKNKLIEAKRIYEDY